MYNWYQFANSPLLLLSSLSSICRLKIKYMKYSKEGRRFLTVGQTWIIWRRWCVGVYVLNLMICKYRTTFICQLNWLSMVQIFSFSWEGLSIVFIGYRGHLPWSASFFKLQNITTTSSTINIQYTDAFCGGAYNDRQMDIMMVIFDMRGCGCGRWVGAVNLHNDITTTTWYISLQLRVQFIYDIYMKLVVVRTYSG